MRSTRVSALIAVSVAVALAACGTSVASTRAPSDFAGAGSDQFTNAIVGHHSARANALAHEMRAAGVRLFRIAMYRGNVVHDPSFYDNLIGVLARSHIRALPLIFDARYASRGCGTGLRPFAVPNNGTVAKYARLLTRRYGPKGRFWRRHRRLPYTPVHSWQVWNEPNLKAFWGCHRSPKQYTRLLRAVHGAIKHVDRHAEIVAAGMPWLFGEFNTFLAGMLRAHAGRYFDTVALHPYATNRSSFVAHVRSARRTLNRHRARRKRIWITEFGWSGGGPRVACGSRCRVSASQQPKLIGSVVKSMIANRRRLGLRGFVYYQFADNATREGLVRKNGGKKAAFYSFRNAVRPLYRRRH